MEKIPNPLSPQDKAKHIAPLWRELVLTWYKQYGRSALPWRNLSGENASYGVYVSEMMLQQTQVKRVLHSYYKPFMESLPTLECLAYAPEERVLKLWEGLGYYSRARNMLKSAKICVERFSGALPSSYEELIKLPGIGSYSAGAILCFGFYKNVSFVDGNIRRLLCRVFAQSEPKMVLLEELAALLLDVKNSFDYNQALLDIGATLCTPKSPSCLLCPLIKLCQGRNTPHSYPIPKKSTLEALSLHLALCVYNESIALVRSSQGLYHGLYNLPQLPTKGKNWGIKYGQYKHHYTKYAITAYVYEVSIESLKEDIAWEEVEFLPIKSLHSKPLSSLCKKALKMGAIGCEGK